MSCQSSSTAPINLFNERTHRPHARAPHKFSMHTRAHRRPLTQSSHNLWLAASPQLPEAHTAATQRGLVPLSGSASSTSRGSNTPPQARLHLTRRLRTFLPRQDSSNLTPRSRRSNAAARRRIGSLQEPQRGARISFEGPLRRPPTADARFTFIIASIRFLSDVSLGPATVVGLA